MVWPVRLLVLVTPLALASCGGSYNWGWYVVLPSSKQGATNIQFLLGGLWTTISLSLLAIAISVLIGLLVALPGLSVKPAWRRFNRVYVELFRAIPILVMLLWVYYGLPVVLDIKLGVFAAGVIALALCDSAFEAEIFRGGIQSIARGQAEGRGQPRPLLLGQDALRDPPPGHPAHPATLGQPVRLHAENELAGIGDRAFPSSRDGPTNWWLTSTARWRSTPSWCLNIWP